MGVRTCALRLINHHNEAFPLRNAAHSALRCRSTQVPGIGHNGVAGGAVAFVGGGAVVVAGDGAVAIAGDGAVAIAVGGAVADGEA